MKKLICVILPLFMAVSAFAQGNVEITSAKQNFVQSETGSVTQFVFNGTAAEADALKQKAEKLKARLVLEMKKNNSGTYDCVLTVTQQNHAEYAVKMFLTLGFEKVTIDGKEKPVEELASALELMKNK